MAHCQRQIEISCFLSNKECPEASIPGVGFLTREGDGRCSSDAAMSFNVQLDYVALTPGEGQLVGRQNQLWI